MTGEDYSDIISLPHHESSVHPRMPLAQRAAQFAPFAALSGYDESIAERARLTDNVVEDESKTGALNLKAQILRSHLSQHPALKVRYFRPDERKAGGKYVSVSGRLKDIDDVRRQFVIEEVTADDVVRVDVESIAEIEIL